MLAASRTGPHAGAPFTLVAGCGDVGSRLARMLAVRGERVAGLRRSAVALPEGVEVVRADLADAASLSALPRGIEQLVFLPTPDARTPEAYRRIFVDGLERLLDALDGACLAQVVFVSSSAVYGDHAGGWVDEDTPPDPPAFNGQILLEAERRLHARVPQASVLRLAGLYGPGRNGLLQRLRAGKVRVPRALPFWTNRIHVEDAAAAIAHVLSLQAPAPLYLGVDRQPLPMHELYDWLAARLGVGAPAEGPPPTGIGNKRLSAARLLASGFSPRWPDARTGYASLIDPDR